MRPVGKSALVGCVCLVALSGAPAQAQLGPPVSYVSAGCGFGNGVYTNAGPAGAGLQLACDKQESGVHVLYGPYDFKAASSVNSGLEMGGAVDANASLTMTGGEPYTMWGAGAGGYVKYFVGLSGSGDAPPQSVSMVPVKFSASGEARVTDGNGGSFDISAWLDNLSFQRKWEGAGSSSAAFSSTTTVMFSTASNSAYEVLVSAWCHVSTWSAGAGSGSCLAAADPSFSFDQAAFDASMGADTFALDRYYRIDLSPGVTAVPEPAAGWMALAGGLVLWVRRRRAVRTRWFRPTVAASRMLP